MKMGSDVNGQLCASYLRRVHDYGGNEIEEDVIAVCAHCGVIKGHLQLIHGLKQQTFCLIMQVFKRCLLHSIEPHADTFPTRYTDVITEDHAVAPTLVTKSEWRMMARTKKR